MCHLCAILNGAAGIIVFSGPSAVSAAWFPPNERTTATAVGIAFNNLGNAASFFLGPAIVPDPSHKKNQTDLIGDDLMGYYSENMDHLLSLDSNDSNGCPVVKPDENALITYRIFILMIVGGFTNKYIDITKLGCLTSWPFLFPFFQKWC